MVESFPILTILPPLVAIIMVIATRKVLASLASGVILSILLITNFHPVESLKLLFSSVLELFWADGAPNWYNILILAFLLELGAIDRKSTRLNSSHVAISSYVFCLE